MRTARHTSTLHSTPRANNVSGSSVTFEMAVDTAVSPTRPSLRPIVPAMAIRATRIRAPSRLPNQTITQLRTRAGREIRRAARLEAISELPVNSSAPQHSTRIRPMQNASPPTKRLGPQVIAGSQVTMRKNSAPKPMNAPANRARMKVTDLLCLVLLTPALSTASSVSAVFSALTCTAGTAVGVVAAWSATGVVSDCIIGIVLFRCRQGTDIRRTL